MTWMLIFCYLLLALLLLSLNLRSNWPWLIKAAAIVITSAGYYLTYVSLNGLQGYPTAASLPERFEVQWVLIDEPDKISGAEGQIYIWLRELDHLKQPMGLPRAHSLGFDEALAERTQEALTMIEGGERVVGFVQIVEADPEEDGAESGKLKKRPGLGEDDANRVIEFKAVEQVDLPPKPAL